MMASESASCAWEAARLFDGHLGALVMRHFHGHDTAPTAAIVSALGGAACGPGGAPVGYTFEMPRLPLVVLAARAHQAQELAAALG
jgi:fructose-1,6-bisphosphatase/inositol monophosphatase family enzyme